MQIIDKAIQEAKEEKHQTLEDLATEWHTGINTLRGYEDLRIGTVGVAPIAVALVKKQLNRNISEAEVLEFCKDIPEYHHITREEAVLNIEEFIRNTLTLDEAQEEVSGKGWLADKVFEYCREKVSKSRNIYLTIGQPRIHRSNLTAIEEYQKREMSLDVIRKAIYSKLEVDKLTKKYVALNNITRNTDKNQIADITKRVDDLIENGYDKEQIEAQLGVRFSNPESLKKLIESTSEGMQFMGGKYHKDDVDCLDLVISVSSEELKISKQSVIRFIEEGRIKLNQDGLSAEEISRLISNSYSESEMISISPLLKIGKDKLKDHSFTHKGTTYYLGDMVRNFVMDNNLGIRSEAVSLFIQDDNWRNYMQSEVGNGKKDCKKQNKIVMEIEDRLIKYLLRDLGIEEGLDKTYSGKDICRLKEYCEALQTSNIHRLSRFRTVSFRHDASVDSNNSVYTATEAESITGLRKQMLENVCKKIGVKPAGDDKFKFYTVSDVSKVIEYISPPKIFSKFNDPLDIIMLNGLFRKGYFKVLDVEFTQEGRYIQFSDPGLGRIANLLKIDTNLCAEKAERAFSYAVIEVSDRVERGTGIVQGDIYSVVANVIMGKVKIL